MSKHQVIFINADFVFHIVRDDDNEPVYICYMREDGKFQEISTGHADSLNAVCASELKNLIRNVNDPAFDMLEVPVYMSPDSSITDLDRWYIRQMIAVYNHGQTFPAYTERLYRSGRSYLYVCCEADEGWNYALYDEDNEHILRLMNGGYIEGRITEPIDEIASIAAGRLHLTDPIEKAGISVKQLFEWVEDKEDMKYRGVKVFLSPELKAAGIDAIPSEMLDVVKKTIDERLASSILMSYQPERGYQMNLVNKSEVHDTDCVEVPLPDGTTGILCLDPSVKGDSIGEYDIDWAKRLWLQDIHISIRGGKHVLDSSCE